MSYFLAFVGFVVLIVLHEAGHFVAAKAVGMRVERFSLFFGRIAGVQIGETDYAIGAIPAGGYVKISGMNPREEIPPEHVHRAYFRQPVWKRVVVILAGPAVNLVLAFAIFWGVFATQGPEQATSRVAAQGLRPPASSHLRPGDRIVAVDGQRAGPERIPKLISAHKCPGRPTAGCRAATPARITVQRDGRRQTFAIYPRYRPTYGRTLVGFSFQAAHGAPPGVLAAGGKAGSAMGQTIAGTASAIVARFTPHHAGELHSVVGAYVIEQQSFAHDPTLAFLILADISLALAVFNLFPFLPLDGGHVFWALAEKVRGRAIPFVIMERAGAVGMVLIVFLAVAVISNDVSQLAGGGIHLR